MSTSAHFRFAGAVYLLCGVMEDAVREVVLIAITGINTTSGQVRLDQIQCTFLASNGL